MNNIKKIIKLIVILVALFVLIYFIFVAALILKPKFQDYFNQEEFSSSVWKSNLETNSNIKQKMFKSLVAQHKLKGMSKQALDQLIGKPPKSEYFKECDYLYWLGFEKGMGVDSEWFCIIFNNDIVIDFRVVRD